MINKSKQYENIAKKLIKSLPELEYIKNSNVKIAYLASDLEKKKDRKIVFADCTKVSERYKWCCNYDFFITVYEQNCISFNEQQFEILINHELHHVGICEEGNEPSYYIVPHDIEEFWDIINKHGLEWSVCQEETTQTVEQTLKN